MKYQPRSQVIDAVQWMGNNRDEVEVLTDKRGRVLGEYLEISDESLAAKGNWIVKNQENAVFVLSDSDFNRRYKPADKNLVEAGGTE